MLCDNLLVMKITEAQISMYRLIIHYLEKNKTDSGCIYVLNRGSYMSAHVLLNLLNELGKRDNM